MNALEAQVLSINLKYFLKSRLYDCAINCCGDCKIEPDVLFAEIAENRVDTWVYDFISEYMLKRSDESEVIK